MPVHHFDIVHYDASRPWVVLSTERTSVELADGANPYEWAAETYPDPNVKAVLQPGPPPGG